MSIFKQAAKFWGLASAGSRVRGSLCSSQTLLAIWVGVTICRTQPSLRAIHDSNKRFKSTMPETPSSGQLVWIDCEMTGLDSDRDSILSIACFITGPDLDLVDPRGYETVIHHDQESLDQMGEWCRQQHGASGLTAAATSSNTSAEEAADGLLQYIQTYIKEPRKALLAGNTVHADKAFLMKPPFTPVIEYLHHRILDVSSIKEAARRWSPKLVLDNTPPKQGLHEAKADILESIAEARYYRREIFGKD